MKSSFFTLQRKEGILRWQSIQKKVAVITSKMLIKNQNIKQVVAQTDKMAIIK